MSTLLCAEIGASSTRLVIGLLGRHLGGAQVGGEHRREDDQAEDHAEVPGADRPAAVQRAGQPIAHGGGGQPVQRQPEPEADQRLRRDGPHQVGRRQQRQTDQPTGDEEAPGGRLDAR